jgi:hypothetical protein
MLGLNALGADDERLAAASILLFPIAGFGGGWLFMRYH